MIHKFSAQNFYSFEDEVVVDFRVDENAPANGGYCTTKSGTRLSLVQAVVGPNASGKTTALRALSFINWFIVKSFRHNMGEIPVMVFAGNRKSGKPIKLSIEFETDNGVHVYNLEIDEKRLLKEELLIKSLTKKRVTSKKLFTRQWNEQTKSYTLDDTAFDLRENYWSNEELGNTSIIAAAYRFGHGYAKHIVDYWKRFETNVEIDERFIPYRYGAYQALRYYESHEDSRRQAEKDVRRYADLGIESFGKDGMIKHRFGDSTYELDFEHESSGTRQFLSLIRMMDSALEKGGMVVVDEFDAYLHPQMVVSLVGKFLKKNTNKGHAQLLLSVHELLILNLLSKYQINLARKNNRGATKIWRLDSEKGIRSDDNLFAKYAKGTYGAWPTINESSE